MKGFLARREFKQLKTHTAALQAHVIATCSQTQANPVKNFIRVYRCAYPCCNMRARLGSNMRSGLNPNTEFIVDWQVRKSPNAIATKSILRKHLSAVIHLSLASHINLDSAFGYASKVSLKVWNRLWHIPSLLPYHYSGAGYPTCMA